ncbi:hypothetical protein J7L67_01270 [bacterium]|nr:hypothetical protein [bacterium]
MKDKKLEQQIRDFEEFISLWKEFYRLFTNAAEKKEITEQDEADYFNVKTYLARHYTVMMNSLDIDNAKDEKSLEIITQAVTLSDASQLSDGIAKRIITVWHTKYLEFQKLLGMLEHNRDELDKISSFKLFLKKLFTNPVSIVIYILIAVSVIIFLFYDQLSEIIPYLPNRNIW